MAFA
jgi:hypothetical protein